MNSMKFIQKLRGMSIVNIKITNENKVNRKKGWKSKIRTEESLSDQMQREDGKMRLKLKIYGSS